MKSERISVLFCTEGTYPFFPGGVSSWCQNLISNMKDADFKIVSVVGNQNVELLYELPSNVKNLYSVPLWNIEEPFGYTNGYSIFHSRKKKVDTTEEIIEKKFIPLFIQFLDGIENKNVNLYDYAIIFSEMNFYFEKYDYSKTMFSKVVWETFKSTIYNKYIKYNTIYANDELPTIYDLTTCMRWLFHLLMVVNIPISKTDLVHSSVAAFASLPGVISKVRYKTPFLLTEHGVYLRERYYAIITSDIPYFSKRFLINLTSLISRLTYEVADQISPVCKFNTKWEKFFGVDENKIRVIYNGIDPFVFMPRKKPLKYENTPIVIVSGKVSHLKDTETAIRTAKIVKKRFPNVLFLHYGSYNEDSNYYEKCKRLIQELDLKETFIFKGHKADNPFEIYNEGDLTFLPSISEGFPYTILESLSCEKPVVATDVGGIPEVLEGCGLIIQPKDYEAKAQAIIELLLDKDLREELGKKGRERIKTEFNVARNIELYELSYKNLIDPDSVVNSNQNVSDSFILRKMIRDYRKKINGQENSI